MKTVILDLTGCKYSDEVHERIRKAFDFPEWYGKNWDAFWDLLRSECDADMLRIKGIKDLPPEFSEDIRIMFSILDKNTEYCRKYSEMGMNSFSYETEE